MSELQKKAAAMKNLELDAMEERNAARLKRECRYLMTDRLTDLVESSLTVDVIKRRQALLDTEDDRIQDDNIARSAAEFGKQPPPFHSPSIFISKKGSY